METLTPMGECHPGGFSRNHPGRPYQIAHIKNTMIAINITIAHHGIPLLVACLMGVGVLFIIKVITGCGAGVGVADMFIAAVAVGTMAAGGNGIIVNASRLLFGSNPNPLILPFELYRS